MKKQAASKILSLIMAFSMILSLLPSLSSGALADGSYVAVIGNQSYTSFKDAWDVVANNGGTINLQKDWDWDGSSDPLSVLAGKSVTLNLNGHVLNRHLAGDTDTNETSYGCILNVMSGATLTVNGGKDEKTPDTTTRHYGRVSEGVWYQTTTEPQNPNVPVDLTGGIIAGGYSSNTGGAIHIAENATVTLNGVTVAGNISAYSGGAAMLAGDNAKLITNGSRLIYNKSEDDAGGVLVNAASCSLSMTNSSEINNNTANDKAGGVYIYGKYCHISMDSTSSISSNNSSDDGGGVYIGSDYCSIAGGAISGNTCTSAYSGGGIYAYSENNCIYNCTLQNNTAKWGGGIYVNNDGFSISDCTITYNTATDAYGGGVYCTATANISLGGNCQIHNNTAGGALNDLHLGSESQHTFIKSVPSTSSKVGIYCTQERLLTESKGSYSTKQFFSDRSGYYIKFDQTERKLYYAAGTAPAEVSPSTVSPKVTKWSTYTNNNQTYDLLTGYFSFNSISSTVEDIDSAFYYSDGFFAGDPTSYNEHLATMSLDLAMSAFNASAGNFKDDTKRIFNNRFAHVKQLLSDIGCSDDNTWISPSYLTEPTTDSIACAISQKELKTSDGKDTGYTLVPIAIRGANYDKEWVSNVTVGAGTGEAEGFASAANTVTKAVTAYIRDYNLQSRIDAGKVKFWVVGYSRAGATANLTSKRLVDAYSKIGKAGSFNQIYGYDFEAPQGGVTSAEVSGMDYSCIHNLINKTDVVPKVAPTVMGFKRYGADVYMPQYSVGTADYETQKALMLNQLTAVNPSITFDDYFHLATVNYLGSTILAFYAYDQIGEVDDPTGTKAEAWLDTFVDNFVNWALEDNSRGVAGTGTLRQRYAANTIWGTETFQTALQNIVGLVYSKPPETAKNIKDSASSIMDKLSTLQLRDIYDNVIGDWYTLPDEGYYNTDGAYVSGKKDYVDFLGNKLVYEKPGLDQYLKEGEITDLSKDWKVLLDVLFTFIDEDYSKNNQQLLGTLAYNSSTIMESHYPEINLAWLRSLDNFYRNDTTPVQIDDSEITPAVPTSSNNLSSDTYSGNQTLKLTSTAGSAIYYTVSINGGTATDAQLYGTGIPLTVVNNANTTYKITAYSQAYWKMRESGSDLISNIGKAKSGSFDFTYTITVPPVLTVNAYNTNKTAVEDTKNSYSAGTKVTINANVPDDQVFVNWTTSDAVSFGNAKAATTTITMPSKDVKVTANYKSRVSAISMDIAAPTAGAALAAKTANLKYGNDGQTDVPVTWSAGTTAIGSTAAYNTEYTATVVLTGDQFLSSTTATVNGENATVTRNEADGSLTITCTFPKTAMAKVNSVVQPAGISVAYETADISSLLPQTVTLNADDGYYTGGVVWNTTNYVSTNTGDVTLTGVVTPPDGIDLNGNSASIIVNVANQPVSTAPKTASGSAPGIYTIAPDGSKVIYLTAAAGANIYYTTDNSTPTDKSTLYTDSGISLTQNTTVKAIAIESRNAASSTAVFNYTIKKVYTCFR